MTEHQRASTPIRSWSLRNFKSVENASLSFAPLTVLIGANSSGKSSLLQSILLVSQAAAQAATTSPGIHLPLNGPLVEMGDFDEVLFAGSGKEMNARGKREFIEFSGVFDLSGIHRGVGRSVLWQTLAQREGIVEWAAQFSAASRSVHLGAAQLSKANLAFRNAEGVEVVAFRSKVMKKQTPLASRWADMGAPVTPLEGSLNEADLKVMVEGVSQIAGVPTQFFIRRRLAALVAEQTVERGILSIGGRRERGEISTVDLSSIVEDLGPQALSEYLRLSGLEEIPASLAALAEGARVARRPVSPRPLREQEHSELIELLTAWVERVVDHAMDRSGVEHTALVPFDRPIQRGMRTDRVGAGLVQFLARNILYLGPLREDPHVLYTSSPGDGQGNVGKKGERTIAILHQFASSKITYPSAETGQILRGTLGEAVNHWLQYFGIAENFETELRPRLGLEPHLKLADVQRQLDLTSVGVGVSQVLPVLVMGLYASRDTVLLMEQPELHLHPALQHKLGDFLLACARAGKQLIVETHSDHLVTRLRRRIAESESEDLLRYVKLIFAERTNGRTTYTPVEISPFGSLPTWPAGFFDQGSTESKELLRAAVEKRSRLIKGADEPPS